MNKPNIHPVTGIAYGVINANSLDGDILQNISFDDGIDALNIDRLVDFAKMHGFEVPEAIETESTFQFYKRVESELSSFMSDKCAESENISDEYNSLLEDDFTGHLWYCDMYGVSTVYNTDSNIVMVLESTKTAMVSECSPCYPNAGDLDTPNDNGIEAYTVPFTWKYSID